MKVTIEKSTIEKVEVETSAFKKDPVINYFAKIKEDGTVITVLDGDNNYFLFREKKIDDKILELTDCTEEEFNNARESVIKKYSEL